MKNPIKLFMQLKVWRHFGRQVKRPHEEPSSDGGTSVIWFRRGTSIFTEIWNSTLSVPKIFSQFPLKKTPRNSEKTLKKMLPETGAIIFFGRVDNKACSSFPRYGPLQRTLDCIVFHPLQHKCSESYWLQCYYSCTGFSLSLCAGVCRCVPVCAGVCL